MRSIGMDVHRDFCEVAIAEAGHVRSVGRVASDPETLAPFGSEPADTDEVAIEATSNALAIARILESHARRVVLVKPKAVRDKATGHAKTDRIDARLLAQLLAIGCLDRVRAPDEPTRVRRRLISRRRALVRQRAREKKQVHAVLHRNLRGPAPVSDLFGVNAARVTG